MSSLTESRRQEIVDSIARSFEKKCKDSLGENLEALYIFGSYVTGKISLDKPDINYFVLFKEKTPPEAFLKLGNIINEVIQEFKHVANIRPEFRNMRYIYPRVRETDFDVSINAQPGRMEDAHVPDTPFWWGHVFAPVLEYHKLVFGRDALAEVHMPPLTKEYLKRYFMMSFVWFQPILERAPAQYAWPEESDLLMHEAHEVAKMVMYGFGTVVAMNDKELEEKKWIYYTVEKPRLVQFYRERYDEAAAKDVEFVLDMRGNWLKYRKDPEMAKKMFKIAIDLCIKVRNRYFEFVSGR